MGIEQSEIQDKLKEDYIKYAVYVIHNRAIPRVEDGLKPIHRKLLWTLYEMGALPNSKFRKCAAVSGNTTAKYHPHGNVAAYEALVSLAVPWYYRYPLVQPQGNFGSRDGDKQASERYTESKLSDFGQLMLEGVEKDCVDFVDNYTQEFKEPDLLPSRIPNILINPCSGIAVGLATTLLPHNLKEICEAVIYYIDNPDCSVDKLLSFVKGPDFPTGGNLFKQKNFNDMYKTGQGSFVLRGSYRIEETKNRKEIVIYEIPWQIDKCSIVKEISENIQENKITGISEITDASGFGKEINIILSLHKDAIPDVVINQLCEFTRFQTKIHLNMTILDGKEPKIMSLIDIFSKWFSFRKNVIKKQFEFDLKKLNKKYNLVCGYITAVNNIEEIVSIIKSKNTHLEAQTILKSKYILNDEQSQSILDMKLSRLIKLELDSLLIDKQNTETKLKYIENVLKNESDFNSVIKQDITEIIELYGDVRKTEISGEFFRNSDILDLIPKQDYVFIITEKNQFYKEEIGTQKIQNKNNVGTNFTIPDTDSIKFTLIVSSHSRLCVFTNLGNVYVIDVVDLPNVTRKTNGKDFLKYLNLKLDESISLILPVLDFKDTENKSVFFVTKFGYLKRVSLSEVIKERSKGISVINLEENDYVVSVLLHTDEKEIMIIQSAGYLLRTSVEDVRMMGRTARGTAWVSLDTYSSVIAADWVKNDSDEVLLVTSKGMGKSVPLSQFMPHGRKSKGSCAILLKEGLNKYGDLIFAATKREQEYLMLITDSNKILKIEISDVKSKNKYTVGNYLIKLPENGKISTVNIF